MPFLLFPDYLFESGQREAPGNSYPSHFKDSNVNLVAKNRNKIQVFSLSSPQLLLINHLPLQTASVPTLHLPLSLRN